MNKKMSRRDFNALVSKTAMSLPIMTSLVEKAYGQISTAPKRLIVIRSKNGFLNANWSMNSGQPWDRTKVKTNDPIFGSQAVQHSADCSYIKLSNMSYTNYIIENTNLKNYKNQMNYIRGLDMMTWHNHNSYNFTCTGTLRHPDSNEEQPPSFTYSFDEVFKKKVINASQFSLPLLRIVPAATQVGVDNYMGVINSISYYPGEGEVYGSAKMLDGSLVNVKRMRYLTTNQQIFQTLFAGSTQTDNTLSLLTKVRTQLVARSSLMAQKRSISSSDKQKLQNFVDHLNGLALGSSTGGGGGAVSCNNGSGLSGSTDLGRELNYNRTMDLVVQALACQKSQMAVIAIGDNQVHVGDANWHNLTHDGQYSPTNYFAYEGFVANQVAYLLNKLSTTTDVDGNTMLHNTLVVLGAEHACGNNHEGIDMPIMTFGGTAFSNLQQGYYIDYRKRNPSATGGSGPLFYVPLDGNNTDTDRRAYGRPFNDFLVTLFQIMGVSPATYHASNLDGKYGSVGTFGSTTVGFGEYSHPATPAWDMATNVKGANDIFKNVYRSILPSDDPLPFLWKAS